MQWLSQVLNELLSGYIGGITPDFIIFCGNEAKRILEKQDRLNDYDISCMNLLIQISQILYNNTDRIILCLEDGVYDLLLERLKYYNQDFQNGAIPIQFGENGEILSTSDNIRTPMEFLDEPNVFLNNSLFYENLKGVYYYKDMLDQDINRNSGIVLKKNNILSLLVLLINVNLLSIKRLEIKEFSWIIL